MKIILLSLLLLLCLSFANLKSLESGNLDIGTHIRTKRALALTLRNQRNRGQSANRFLGHLMHSRRGKQRNNSPNARRQRSRRRRLRRLN